MYEEGREPPEEFFKQPEVWQELQPIWIAFFDLSTERQIGMGMGPIPHSQVRAYAREMMDIAIPSDEFDRFRRLIADLDNEYMAHVNKTSSSVARGKEKEPEEINVNDAEGMHGMFRRLAARQKHAKPITKKQRMN